MSASTLFRIIFDAKTLRPYLGKFFVFLVLTIADTACSARSGVQCEPDCVLRGFVDAISRGR